jgi:formylglycine-generating enzyme required for sulfatase activity
LLWLVGSSAVAEPPKPLKAPFTKEQAKAAQEAWAKYLGKKVEEEIDIGGGLKMVFELIPPGTFMMGSPEEELKLKGDDEAFDNEVPRHEVTITKPFYLGKCTVTQGEYVQLTGKANPSWFSASGDGRGAVAGLETSRFPVEEVNWDDAVACASALKTKLGAGWVKARLPSEAMWEYACRAGTETRWHVGNRLTSDDAHFGQSGEGKMNRTREVGGGAANGFGLYDMHGNVWQWCSSGYEKYPSAAQTDPEPIGDGWHRVFRGGSWKFSPRYCRPAFRYGSLGIAEGRSYDLGFRLALIPSGQEK